MNTLTIDPSAQAKRKFEAEGKKENHYNQILKALSKIGEGCAKAIAKATDNLDRYQVSRRLRELEKMGKIVMDRVGKSKHFESEVGIYKLA